MRRTLILTLAVLACALAVCWISRETLNATVERAQLLHNQALLAENSGDSHRAGELLVRLAQLWRDREGLLELLASHDALHDVAAAIVEARICLECRDHDDFLRTMSTVNMGLEHLMDEEAVRWENLY
jgi:uncharacterized protein Yka (UPF0111/DUF47 family)